nr:class I SAM-dependent methyltransferase [uncultured Rhodoferax sp.]
MQSWDDSMTSQTEIDARNRRFWDELCGTQLARALRITPDDEKAIETFDRAYLDMYPYLLDCVPVGGISGKKVLEIGLGYGTLGQQLFTRADQYRGLDIAQGPVDMMNTRIERIGLPTERFQAVQGSMLDCPFSDGEFDVVVSIGCFHHTGNLRQCIEQTYRVLKPGGVAFIMVYNKFSYRNWQKWPGATLGAVLHGRTTGRSREERASYDANLRGEAAPETVFTSIRELREMCSAFSDFRAVKRNCGVSHLRWGGVPRLLALPLIGPLVGLDVYVTVEK